MKPFLKTKLWPVIAGLLSAFIIMIICELINSQLFPFPAGMDKLDHSAVKAFTDTLPWTAYILVVAGWALGSFKAGCVTTYLSGENTYKLSFLVAIILTLLGLFNNFIIGAGMFFNTVALVIFFIFTYLGHRYLRYVHSRRMMV